MKKMLKLYLWAVLFMLIIFVFSMLIITLSACQGRGYENENSIEEISCAQTIVDFKPQPLFFLKQKEKCSDATGV